jgi:DNA/RNA-binding domain of Phe-tRNA-synthetase-like protein
MRIIRDENMNSDSHVGILEVKYPDAAEWDTAAFEQMRDRELEAIRREGEKYDRETWFRQDPYFRYFRKFKKTYPIMMQVESFLLKGRPFPEERYVNAVAFLTELKTRVLAGTHDADRVEGDIVFYTETEKVPFPSIHGSEGHSYPGDVTGRDDGGVIISMIAGADSRTCLQDDSSHVLYLIFGSPGMKIEAIDEYLDQLEEYVKVLAPAAETERHFV